MNIRTLVLVLLSASILNSALPAVATMEDDLKKVVEHAGQELEKAGKEIIKTLPTKIDLEFAPKNLWMSILSVAGAVFIYKGFNQMLHTWKKTDEQLKEKKENRTYGYKVGVAQLIAGFLSLGASLAVWNWK